MKKAVFILFISGMFLAAAWAGAQEKKISAVDPDVLEKAKTAVKERFPDADNVLLCENESYTYETSGTYRATDELYVRILTEKGRDSLRRLSFYFNTHYNRIKIHSLAVIKPGGRVEKVDVARNSRVVIDSSQMASNIYDPASKRLVISIPRIEVGDILYIKSSDEHFKPRIPGFWSNYSLLQSDWPILENNIRVDAPLQLPLRSVALKDEVRGTVTFSQEKRNGRILYRWSARNVPQVIREPGMPELHTCVQRLLVSTARSWQEVSRWYWQLCRPRLDAVTPAMKSKVQELIRGKKGDMEKIKALFQYVSQNIRYMGITPEKEAPGYEPHDVKMTFEQSYGVCRDKAALLVAMLELANYKAYPVLFMAGDPKDDEIPNGYFNHAVTAVELEKGNYILMDPTYESTTDLFPAFQADMSCLVAHPEGEKLRRSPVVPSLLNKTLIRTKAHVDAADVLHGESVIKLSGVNDIYYRGALSRWPQEKKEQFFTDRLRRVLPGAKLEKLTVIPENIRDMSRNLEFLLRYSAAVSQPGTLQMLRLPELSELFGIGGVLFQDTELLKRKYPLKLAATSLTDESLSLRLPESWRILSLPDKEKLQAGSGISYLREVLQQKNTVTLKKQLNVNTLEVKAAEYSALKKLLNTMADPRKNLPLAERDFALREPAGKSRNFPGADSILETRDVTVDITGLTQWRLREKSRRKILNYAGVKAHSEIKLPFVPGWNDVRIISVSVTAPDGRIRKVKAHEINVMDAPRNGSAPRYPAGKITVVSLPGVVPGSSVEIETERTYIKRPFFSEQICFSSLSAPVISGTLTVNFPEHIYLRSQVTGDAPVEFSEKREEKRFLLKWQFKNLPRMRNESGLPPWQLFASGVLLSSESNRDYAARLNKLLLEKCRESRPAARALIAREKWLATEKKELLLLKIRDFTDKFIRRVSVPLREIPLTALSNAGVTLESGYGNSADRAILIGALLQELKIDFQFVAVSSLGASPSTTRLFNYNPDPERLIEEILVFIPDLHWYLNDTGRFDVPGGVNAENKLALELRSGSMSRIQGAPMTENSRSLAFYVECRADDSAVIKVTETLYGKAYGECKKLFETATPERRKRFFEARATAVAHNSVLEGEGEYDFKNHPGILRYTVKAADHLRRSGEFRILPLPRYGLLAAAAAVPASEKRTAPWWRNEKLKLSLRYSIVPPPGFEAVPSRKEKVQSGKFGSAWLTENYSAVSGQISLFSRLVLPVELISVQDLCEEEKRREYLTRPESDRIVFKKISHKRQ